MAMFFLNNKNGAPCSINAVPFVGQYGYGKNKHNSYTEEE
jgi:hypothetical protein